MGSGGGGASGRPARRSKGTWTPPSTSRTALARSSATFSGRASTTTGFARLLLVAPPRFLGYLRGVLREPVLRHVARSVDRDYTRHEERELRRLLDFPAERK
ncbi:MAG: host attachment protein [Planctomycetota bacterium]